MSGIIFETFDGSLHGSVRCAPVKDWVVGTETAPTNGVHAFESAARAFSVSNVRGSVRCSPSKDWVVAREEVVNGVHAFESPPLVYATSISSEPTVNLVFGGESTLPHVIAIGHLTFHGSVLCAPAKDWVVARENAANGVAGFAPKDVVFAVEHPLFVGMAYIAQTAGYMLVVGDTEDLPMAIDSGVVTSAIGSLLTKHAVDSALAVGATTTKLTGTSTAADQVIASDAPSIVWQLVAASTAAAEDGAVIFLDMLLEAADVALALGVATSALEAYALVSAIAEAHDTAIAPLLLVAESAAEVFDEAALSRVVLLAQALDAAAAADASSSIWSMVVVAADSALVDAAPASSLDALLAAFDAGTAVATVRIGSDVFVAYAMTIAGAAVSEYVDIPFNSQVVHDGKLYVGSDTGIYLMEGADDDGEPINASVRVGLNALGTQLKKAIPAAYVGYTADGTLFLKVSTTDAGVKRTNIYKLNPVRKDVVSDNRFTPSKGLHSVYWDFEISNYEGADFTLETIKVWRMPLNRRK
jgi:hypothetical protein